MNEQPPSSLDWKDIRIWRSAMRRTLIAGRLSVDRVLRSAQGEQAKALLAATVDFGAYENLGIYWPVRGEIDVRDLALQHLKRGGRVALPVVVREFAPVEFWGWRPGIPMRRGVWNIPIPAECEPLTPDALIVPLVGFDRQGYRLGYGGGYYDRTLAVTGRRPLCAGLGYKEAQLNSIFPQAHDIPMDVIVTDGQQTAKPP